MLLVACDITDGESYESLSIHREDVTDTSSDGVLQPADDIILEHGLMRVEKIDTALSHLFTPDTTSDSTSDVQAPDTAVPDEIEVLFTETIPCTEDWHCAPGKECTPDGLCITQLVWIAVITGSDGSHPPVLDHSGEEVTLWYGREPWTETHQVPYTGWLPLAELCESGIEMELRNPSDDGYPYGEGCVTDFKNLTPYLFAKRLEFTIHESGTGDMCPEMLHIARDQLPCDKD